MATNYVQEGDTVTVAAPSGGVTSGNAYLITGIFGVATTTTTVGLDVELATEGVWTLTKVGSQAWSVGDRIYWDDANARCTSDAGGGIYIGVATEAVGSGSDATTGKVRLNGIVPQIAAGLVSLTAATATITAAKHAGKTITMNRAGGMTVTLPAASGSGNRYDFIVGTTFTSSGIIQVVGNDIIQGVAWLTQDSGDTVVAFETAADSDTITMTGTASGGYIGTRITLIDIAADTWFVEMFGKATGSEASPFSANVT